MKNIKNSVTSIGNYAFSNCTSLITLNYNGTINEWNAVTKGTMCFINISATKVVCLDGEVAL